MTYVQLRGRLFNLGVGSLHGFVHRAPYTRYRSELRAEIEKLICDMDRAEGITTPLPLRTRALLLLVRRPVAAAADEEAVDAYIRAIASGDPANKLAELVQATGCPELMRRFVLYGPPAANLAAVKQMQCVAQVLHG